MRLRSQWPVYILILSVFLAYGNVYHGEFFYDDEFLIVKNAFLRDWSGLWRVFAASSTGGSGGSDAFYRPLQGFIYVLVYQIFGLSTFGFHFLNVSIHAANAILLYRLGLTLRLSPLAAFFGAWLWCVHPLHTEAVTYASATADGLYSFFILIGLNLWLPNRTGTASTKACIAFLLALLSKESAIVFPALAVACIFLLSPERSKLKSYFSTLPFWLIAGAYFLARKTFLNFADSFHFYKDPNLYTENFLFRLYTFFATLPNYLSLLLWPHDLHMDRLFSVYTEPTTPVVVLGAVLVFLSLGLVVLGLFRSWALLPAFAVLWFAAAHVPHSGVLLPVNSFFLEHWLYLPTMGLFLAVGHGLARRPRLAWPVTATLAGICGTLTFVQNRVWATPISFYSRILKFEPRVSRVHNNLAMALSDHGEDGEAIAHYQEAIRLLDTYPQTHHNLALAYLRLGQIDQAVEHLKRALQMDPDFYYSSAVLTEIYQRRGDFANARIYSEQTKNSKQRRGAP